MAKRFTATEKWDKEWFMNLPLKLKCLWVYINDKCDQAGMWEANYKLATMHIGETVSEKDIESFGNRVEKFAPGKIWIVEHVDFQSGTLSEKCLAHKPIYRLLKKYNLLDRVLSRVYNTLKEKETEKEKDKEKEKEDTSEFKKPENPDPLFESYEFWTEQVINHNDQFFDDLLHKSKVKPGAKLEYLARDHLELLAAYPKRRPENQNTFRHSLIKHVKEKLTEGTNGHRQHTKGTSSTIGSVIDREKNYDE